MKPHPHLLAKALALAIALGLATLAPQAARAQAYAGVSLGQARVDLDCSTALSCDRSGFAQKLFGGYMVSHNFAVEGVYYDQGRSRVTGSDATLGSWSADYRGQGLGAYGLLIAPYSNRFSLFGKLGFVTARLKRSLDTSLQGSSTRTERHTNVAWGMGGSWDFSTALGARVEFERVRAKFNDQRSDLDMVSASLLYRF